MPIFDGLKVNSWNFKVDIQKDITLIRFTLLVSVLFI